VGKKISLPLAPDAWTGRTRETADTKRAVKKPSLDDARNRLGGRTTDEEPAPPGISPGRIVRVVATGGAEHVAVVVFANADEIHLLIDGTRLRRVPPAAVDFHEGPTPNALTKIAADAHVFSRLSEGQPVRYADDRGGLLDGKLVEKCRYGALVVRGDGAVVAVGFRKLWPAASSGGAA
jgi:hypothetical protein